MQTGHQQQQKSYSGELLTAELLTARTAVKKPIFQKWAYIEHQSPTREFRARGVLTVLLRCCGEFLRHRLSTTGGIWSKP